MATITNKNGHWTLHGINLIPSDEIYKKIQRAIEEGNLSESHLQEITGHRLPIDVDFNERSIHFINF